MLAALSNLPRWLLALVAACVLTGYSHQVECKLTGCESTVAAAPADGTDPDGTSAPHSGEQPCQCPCHFVTLSLFEVPLARAHLMVVSGTPPFVWIANVPEAPCAEIEHPPQLI